MSDKPEEGWLVALWDAGAFEREDAEFVDAELRRLHAENERLNNALQWEQNRFERIGTHGPGCHAWGHRHYECLLRQYKSLLDALETLMEHFEYYMDDNECRPVENARAAIAKATGEKA